MDGLASGVALQSEQAEHERRLAYLYETGWELTEEGLVKDASDPRWSKRSREIVPYDENLAFGEAVKSAWRLQKCMEAAELAERQRRGVRKGES
jgi:hypothetical protein